MVGINYAYIYGGVLIIAGILAFLYAHLVMSKKKEYEHEVSFDYDKYRW